MVKDEKFWNHKDETTLSLTVILGEIFDCLSPSLRLFDSTLLSGQHMKKRCIFHVEDNPIDQRILAFGLKKLGVSVDLLTADDGEAALELLKKIENGDQSLPDVVVLDLNVPKFSGIEILAQIRRSANTSTIPVAILTSSISPQDRSQTEMLGIQDYLIKPIDIEGMENIARRIINLADNPAGSGNLNS